MEFSQITPMLYVGSRFAPGDWHIMAALGVTVDINLMVESADRFPGSAPEVYLWLPTADWFGPSVHTMQTGAAFINLMIEQDRRVYVHCSEGVGRSPMLVAAYFVYTGTPPDDALAYVQSRHDRTKPNQNQVDTLHQFAESLKTSSP